MLHAGRQGQGGFGSLPDTSRGRRAHPDLRHGQSIERFGAVVKPGHHSSGEREPGAGDSARNPGAIDRFVLVPCDAQGKPLQPVAGMSAQLLAACAQSADLYRRIGYDPPWVSYVATDSGEGVGGGAFVGAPKDGLVEIAYFTVDHLQGRGYATRTAHGLVAIARQAAPGIGIKALTLPEINASTGILVRLGFRHVGMARDVDAGEVWEWRA